MEGQIMVDKKPNMVDKKPNMQIIPKNQIRIDNGEPFICACNGLKCEGICRETHLHRQRGIWASTPEQQGRCPEASKPKQPKKQFPHNDR